MLLQHHKINKQLLELSSHHGRWLTWEKPCVTLSLRKFHVASLHVQLLLSIRVRKHSTQWAYLTRMLSRCAFARWIFSSFSMAARRCSVVLNNLSVSTASGLQMAGSGGFVCDSGGSCAGDVTDLHCICDPIGGCQRCQLHY
jgi:hypothetical protein